MKKLFNFYNKALKIEPQKPELIYNMGLAYAYLGNTKRLKNYIKKLMMLSQTMIN